MVSGSSPVSNSCVFPCGNWFVSQSGWWCPALWLSPSHLFPLVAIHLFLTVALSLLILVVFHLSRRGEFPIVFRLPSRILIYLPELVCPLPPSVFYLSPCFFPVVFQDVVSHSSPSLVVSRLSFKCGLPISSDFVPDVLSRFFPSCLRFHSTPTPPSCLPPADWVPSSLFQLSSNWIP